MLPTQIRIGLDVLIKAFEQMSYINEMAQVYDEYKQVCKYVHSTSRGHEAIQLAVGMQLQPHDFVYPYYRDEAMLMGLGMSPYEMMLQLLAKKEDPFSAGRMYYAHPSLRLPNKPQIPYQSSATGMQAIPATGCAHGLKYKENNGIPHQTPSMPVVVCSLGDGAITEGEVSEAFQMAVLHKLPIIYVIQDNNWSISAYADEFRAMNAVEFARGFNGLETITVDGTDFIDCYIAFGQALATVRAERRPLMLYAPCVLIGHHTSGVRKEFYRIDRVTKEPLPEFAEALKRDPYVYLRQELLQFGLKPEKLEEIEARCRRQIRDDFNRAIAAPEPEPETLTDFYYAPTPITEEKGQRVPPGAANKQPIVMVDAALHALDELMRQHPEALLYGQDVGGRLGGVFREAATLTEKYGKNRVFNTPITEAYIIGSTSGMSAVGLKPVVEVQFADYIWPGLNQLFTELSRSYYLSAGKWPIQSLIRVPIGCYDCGGPFHSSSVESVLCNIRGIKVVYPSNAADMKGLFKAAFYDPNPVVMLEHKGLYWSKVAGTKEAMTPEPDEEYIIPLGKARIALPASDEQLAYGNTCVVITYGRGVYWAINAAREHHPGCVEVIDLRTLEPLDWPMIEAAVRKHNKVLVLTEEPVRNSFAEALSGRIMRTCFQVLDSPVVVVGSVDVPAVPLNFGLECHMLPSTEKVAEAIGKLLTE